jgi:RNA polymerase sigma factor (sigma-70 family)
MLDDLQLIEQFKNNSKSAFEKLYLRYSGKMKVVAYRYTGNREEAEDVLHDAFIKVYEKINSLKDNSLFEGWLRRIVVNQALDFLKAKKKLREITNDSVQLNANSESDERSPYESISPKELMMTLEMLPMGYKTIFNLCVIDGFQHKEVALQLGISEGTSKSQLAKAKQFLRNILSEKMRVDAKNVA